MRVRRWWRGVQAVGLAAVGGVALLSVPESQAYSTGISTFTIDEDGVACSACHSGGVSPTTTFVNGPSFVLTGASNCDTRVRVQGGQLYAGFNVYASGGTLSVGGGHSSSTRTITGSYGTEITHSAPKGRGFWLGVTAVHFSFCWTAPATTGTYTLNAWGNSVNNNGTNAGDDPDKAPPLTIYVCEDDDGDGYYAGPAGCPGTNDCNDGNPNIHPGATEICNNTNDNCSGGTDEGCDNDNDNYCDANMTTVGTPPVCPNGGNDCDDTVTAVNPGATEVCNDVNDNCAGGTDEGCDDDGDNYCDANMTTVGTPSVCPNGGNDCDDTEIVVNPSATEVCNDVNDNCVGGTDEGCDDDGDDYCDAKMTTVGTPAVCPSGTGDCSDGDADINPGATEICNNLNDNCAGGTDEGCDDDSDNYCDATMAKASGVSVVTCSATSAAASVGDDCNDSLPAINPAGTESCTDQGTDNDCDGNDSELEDGIEDGAACSTGNPGICAGGSFACSGGVARCEQTNAQGTETCLNLGADNDCDGDASELTNGVHAGDDCDTGGLGICAAGTRACNGATLDCIQTNTSTNEICDNLDNNCNGTVDEGCDDDDDDFCDAGMSKAGGVEVSTCSSTASAATSGDDCDDGCITCTPVGAEICDGKDNDCAGGVDDNIASLTCGLGICERTADGCIDGVPQNCTPGTPGTETCDNLGTDDDCDGDAAELEDGIKSGDLCDTGNNGICAAGAYACNASDLECVQSNAPVPESCGNVGTDNDCDGDVTEIADGVHVGDDCTTGGSGICAAGTWTCQADGMVCEQTNSPGTEGCANLGVDNDCDGDASELTDGIHAGDGCSTGLPGECGFGARSCNASNILICDQVNFPSSEVCDSKDNDCDGNPDDLPELTCGTGECQRTVPACAGGADNTCVPGDSVPEICDNKDNDCNGTDDNGCDDDGDGYCDADLGKAAGVSVTVCSLTPMADSAGDDCDDDDSAILPSATEVCNNIDDNCAGGTDEGCDDDGDGYCDADMGKVAGLTVTACGSTPSADTQGDDCADDVPGINPAAAETCDDVDENCDSVTDEGCDDDGDNYCDAAMTVTGTPAVCPSGGGDCEDEAAVTYPGATELCDLEDNDCDTVADNDITAITCGVGACQRQAAACIDGVPQDCTPGEPTDEICDDIDNDCDNVVDNGCDDDADGHCDAEMEKAANIVVASCDKTPAEATEGDDCDDAEPAINPSEDEVCNDLDDNCADGADEGCDDDNDGYCDANMVKLNGIAVAVCDKTPAGATVGDDCDDDFAESYPGAPELCDLLDNDCNSVPDDNVVPTCGVGACQAIGTECVNGEVRDCRPGDPFAEICDGQDNDCNGVVDDNLEPFACGVGQCMTIVDTCENGVMPECVPGEPSQEVCDDLDNDCDGVIDNACNGSAGAAGAAGSSGLGGSAGATGSGGGGGALTNGGAGTVDGGVPDGGATGGSGPVVQDEGTCGCRIPGGRSGSFGGLGVLAVLGLWVARRRRGARVAQGKRNEAA